MIAPGCRTSSPCSPVCVSFGSHAPFRHDDARHQDDHGRLRRARSRARCSAPPRRRTRARLVVHAGAAAPIRRCPRPRRPSSATRRRAARRSRRRAPPFRRASTRMGAAGQVAFELGDADGRCAVHRRSVAARRSPARRSVTAQLRSEKPGTTVHFRVVVTTTAGQIVGADQSFTTVAAIARLAPGTTMLGVRVGYLTAAAAQARVRARFARPLVFTYRGKRWKATPKQLGARADVGGRSRPGAHGRRRWALDPGCRHRRSRRRSRTTSPTSTGCSPGRRVPGSVERVGRRAEVVAPQTALAVQTKRMESIITAHAAERRAAPDRAPGDRDRSRRARARSSSSCGSASSR